MIQKSNVYIGEIDKHIEGRLEGHLKNLILF